MKDNVIINYFRESFEELNKVTWPTKNQAVRLTIIVLIFCFIFAVFLTFADYIFNWIYTYLLKITA